MNEYTNESTVLAYLKAVTAIYAPQFPELREFRAMANGVSDSVTLYGYVDEHYNSQSASADTFEQAAVLLREKLGTKADKAASLREEAARLLSAALELETHA